MSSVFPIRLPALAALAAAAACGGISNPDGEDNDSSGRPADAAEATVPAATDASSGTDGPGGGGAGGSEAEPNPASDGTDAAGGRELVECSGVPCLLQSEATCCIGNICGLTDPTTGNCSDPLAGFRDASVEIEPIVSDPACGDITYLFIGTPFTLPGCCDASGVCGGNTGELPTFSGLPFPALCITPREGAPLLVTASDNVPCGGDSGTMATDGGSDAATSLDAQPLLDASSQDVDTSRDGGIPDAATDTD